mgnify:FL=1
MSSLGKILRKEREKQGRTLKEVSDALNIKQEYLKALEKDTYDDIPGVVFVKGFTRNYGNYLGLDGAALVQKYKGTFAATVPQPDVRPAAVQNKPKKVRKNDAKKKNHQGKWPEITIIAGIVICLLLIIWILV